MRVTTDDTTAPTGAPTGPRPSSPVDAVADAYTAALAELRPDLATAVGIPGHDDAMPDLSPAGADAVDDLDRRTLAALDDAADVHADVLDDVDLVTLAAMRERLGLQRESHAAGDHLRDLNNIASPVQGLRDVFDLMPTGTPEAWETVRDRLQALPAAMDGYVETLLRGVAEGLVPAARQVREGVKQARELAGDDSFFTALVGGAEAVAALDGAPGGDALRAELATAAAGARAAYARLVDALEAEVGPAAPDEDAVGRERYARASRSLLGATVDLDETYEWGLEELDRVVAEQQALAEEIAGPGASVEDAVAVLDADPARTLHGTDALQAWMQETADAAVAGLAGVHFDIPDEIRTLECRIAPTQNGGIYYTGPSDDLSRPGRMWWSVPPGVTEFATWREKTTVYHEGVPGHHLQVGQTMYRHALLNSWRRMDVWVSGSGEGWALYAERLMDELGYLSDPGDRMGMLDGQSLRAARVVLDIGVHCGFEAPAEVGGGAWNYDKAWAFLKAHANMADGFLRFELDRYLGWPGQAPSYKIGERLWRQLRTDVQAAQGDSYDAKDFHRKALDVGSIGLDALRTAVLREFGLT